ncbi:MAG: glycerophosphodiester phosphodiesterase [Myxococcales bacterium]|nr:glycerophosphodiester phosphodiesterase [Myxococcales bacterium]
MRSRAVAEESRWGRRSTPLIIAHRGASGASIGRPENTLGAFARAGELGADGIELDVMRCGTGEVVVFHDDDLIRLAKRPERIRETPLEVLREVDLGGGERIPLLSEVFGALGPDLLVNIELKAEERRGIGWLAALRDDGIAHAVAALIVRHGASARTLVSSFDPLLLGRFRRAMPGVATGLLFHAGESRPLREAWAAPLLSPTALHPEAGMVTARALAGWRRGGRAIHVWTVDAPHEVAFLAALGVDGIITNRPAEAREAIRGV